MKTAGEWLAEYSVSHQHPTNIIIHKICVPLITWSLLGMLWTIPTPEFFHSVSANWAHVFIVICIAFYLTLKNIRAFIAIITLVAPAVAALYYLWPILGHRLLYINIGIFVVAWIGQFIGHKIEGKKPSFFQDIQFLLVGPLWTLKDLFKIK